MALLSHCSKNGANPHGQQLCACWHQLNNARSATSRPPICHGSCSGHASWRRSGICSCATRRPGPESIPYTKSFGKPFSLARLFYHSQSNSYRDPQRSDQNHSQPDPDSNSNGHSDTHAIVTRPEYHPNAYANSYACGCLAGQHWIAPIKVSFDIVSETCQLLRVVAQPNCTKVCILFHCCGRRVDTGYMPCTFVLFQQRLTVRFSEFIFFQYSIPNIPCKIADLFRPGSESNSTTSRVEVE